MRILESIAGTATDPGATLTALTMASGDSNTVRQVSGAGDVDLLRFVAHGATAGQARVVSSNLHDSTRGITIPTLAIPAERSFPSDVAQPLVPGDALTLQVSGGGAEIDQAALLIEYNNTNAGGGRFASPGDIKGMIRHIKPVEVDCPLGAGALNWTDTVITVTEDLLHQGSDYAVLGVETQIQMFQLGVKGPDTGNYRIAVPALLNPQDSVEAFIRLSERLGRPCIPIISGANRYQTSLCAFDATLGGGTYPLFLILAELTSKFAG